jgi:hypothetical protein
MRNFSHQYDFILHETAEKVNNFLDTKFIHELWGTQFNPTSNPFPSIVANPTSYRVLKAA